MVKINVDTIKMQDCGNDILLMADSYKTNIKELYKRISEISTKTKEWEGESANNYISKVVKEKQVYDNYYDQLEKMGNFMIDYASNLNSVAIKNEID